MPAVSRSATSLPIEWAADGARLRPNRIYVAHDEDLVTVEAGQLHVGPATPNDGRVDSLLLSAAQTYEEAAIVVVLQGLGPEGATAVAATKQCGGFAIAEGTDQQLEPEGQAVSAAGL